MKNAGIALMVVSCGLMAAFGADDAERHGSGMMNETAISQSRSFEGGVKVLFLGNSITLHGSLPKIGWTNVWGMAASAKEKDYVHIVTRGIEAKTGRKADVRVRNLAEFERKFRTWSPAENLKAEIAFNPDYLVIALGENAPNLPTQDDRLAYRKAFKDLLGVFMDGRTERPNTVMRGVFWPNATKDYEMAHVASDYAVPFVRADLGSDPSMTAKGLFWHGGVQGHPGDKGMAAIADLILEALFPAKGLVRPLAGDNTAQVVKAASRLGDGDTLQFEKGEYHFYEKAGKDLFLASPGSETGMKKALIHLKGLKDVTVDGGGSHFVFHENVFPFVFEDCERVKLRGFTSDVAQLSVAEFVCEEKTKEGFLCRFTSKDIPYSIDDRGVITFTFEGGSVSSESQEISVHALKWCQIHYLCGPSCRCNKDNLASTFFTVRAEDRGDGRVFFRYFDEKHEKHVGEFPFRTGAPLAFLLGCARNRSLAAIRDCRGVTVEDVHVRTGVGMGLVMDMCEDVRISRYRVRPEDGRFVSLTADTMYLVDCAGQIEIDGCEISWAMDDALNIHGNYTQLKAVGGRRIRVRHPHHAYNGYFPYRDGERLEFSRGYGSKRETLGEATVLAFRVPADREAREFEIELDRTVPSDWLGCDVANLSHAPKIRIHGNHFHDFMHIRLSAFADVVFEDNRIENGNSVIMVDDLKGYWGECGPVRDLTVRNNEIVSCRHRCFDIHVPITGRAVFENNKLPEGFRDRPFAFGSAMSAEDRRKFIVSGDSKGKRR